MAECIEISSRSDQWANFAHGTIGPWAIGRGDHGRTVASLRAAFANAAFGRKAPKRCMEVAWTLLLRQRADSKQGLEQDGHPCSPPCSIGPNKQGARIRSVGVAHGRALLKSELLRRPYSDLGTGTGSRTTFYEQIRTVLI